MFRIRRKSCREGFAADADDGVAEGKSFEVLHDQCPQDVLRSVVSLAPGGIPFRKLQEVLVDSERISGLLSKT